MAAAVLAYVVWASLSLPAVAGDGDCDRLAASPHDPQRFGPGVSFEALDAATAIAACEAALALSPQEPRFAFQLGRALVKAGRVEEAAALYREAGRQGHLAALHNLGQLHEAGRLQANSIATALNLYLLAAERGFAPSQLRLGLAYLGGEGVYRDEAKGIVWIDLAAEQGFAPAQLVLALAYESGQGVDRDLAMAHRWYLLAAEQGVPEAVARLTALQDQP